MDLGNQLSYSIHCLPISLEIDRIVQQKIIALIAPSLQHLHRDLLCECGRRRVDVDDSIDDCAHLEQIVNC